MDDTTQGFLQIRPQCGGAAYLERWALDSRIAITDTNGFVGRALTRALCDAGVQLVGIVRRGATLKPGDEAERIVSLDMITPDAFGRVDAVIRLAPRVLTSDGSPGSPAAQWCVSVFASEPGLDAPSRYKNAARSASTSIVSQGTDD